MEHYLLGLEACAVGNFKDAVLHTFQYKEVLTKWKTDAIRGVSPPQESSHAMVPRPPLHFRLFNNNIMG